MIRGTLKEDLGSLNAALAEYARYSKLSPREILFKKGKDLGIRVWRGFWALRLRVSRKDRAKGAIFSGPMFRAAARRGWRVKVRDQVLDEDYSKIAENGGRVFQEPRRKRQGPRFRVLSKRALLVAQELARRQRGAGLLGVSFLLFRWRKNSQGRRLVRNRSGKLGIISSVETTVTEDGTASMVISNNLPGVAVMDGKKGIIAKALREVRADIMPYVRRKQNEEWGRLSRKFLKR